MVPSTSAWVSAVGSSSPRGRGCHCEPRRWRARRHRLAFGALSVAPFARVLLPTETGFAHATRWGGAMGVAATAALPADLEIIGGYTVSYLATLNGGDALQLLSEAFAADVVWHRWKTLALALADRRPFESFDPRAGVRITPGSSFFTNVSAALPLFGRDRTDIGIGVSVGIAK